MLQNHFSGYALPRKIVSGTGSNFIQKKFKGFCGKVNSIIMLLSCNSEAVAYITFIKRTRKNTLILTPCKHNSLADKIYAYRAQTAKSGSHTTQQINKKPATKDKQITNDI